MTGQKYQSEVVRAYFWSPERPQVHDIGTLPWGIHSVGNAINNLDHITGTASTDITGRFVGYLWTRKTGLRQIAAITGGTYTAGDSINDHDEIAGIGFDGAGRIMGFYWSESTGMTLLQTLGGIESAGFGINNNGMIAGYTANAVESVHAALWANHTSAPQDLGTLSSGANSYARGLNNLGQVVGYADVP